LFNNENDPLTREQVEIGSLKVLMEFESHSHRGFSPVISSVTKQGKRLNGNSILG
jgi:hypothetical protein